MVPGMMEDPGPQDGCARDVVFFAALVLLLALL